MTKKCLHCDREIDIDARFCSYCGNSCTEEHWICKKCQTKNLSDAAFCKNCGLSVEDQLTNIDTLEQTAQILPVQPQSTPHLPSYKQPAVVPQYEHHLEQRPQNDTSASKSHHLIYAFISLLIVLTVAIGVSYYYFNTINENRYLSQYAQAAEKIDVANNILVSNITADTLKSGDTADIQKTLQTQKQEIDNIEKKLSESDIITKYSSQHKNLISLLQKESSILDKVSLVIAKPLDNETDNLIKSIKDDIASKELLINDIIVPNTKFTSNANISVIPHQLAVFVEEKRQIYKEKMDRLNAMNTFFQGMDNIIARYDGAKTDFASLLGNVRGGGYTWLDYFEILDSGKSLRSDLRDQVNALAAPGGTENLKSQLSSILTESLRYCDLMSAGAKLEFFSKYRQSYDKYSTAKAINTSVQNDYSSFINYYHSEKTRLTNPDNL